MSFALRITDAGRALLADGNNRQTNAVLLTKLAIGDQYGAGGAPNDNRAALRNQKGVAALGGTTAVSGRIAVSAQFTPVAPNYNVTEMGLLGRVGADGAEVLIAYWTDNGTILARAQANTKLIIAAVLEIGSVAAEVNVVVDATIQLGDPALTASVAALAGRMDTAEDDIDNLEAQFPLYENPDLLMVI